MRIAELCNGCRGSMCRNSVRKDTRSYRGMVMSYINDKINLRGKINLPFKRHGENEEIKQVLIQNL
jgi:hypothetical protein